MALIRTCQAFVSQSEKRNTEDFAASIADQIRSRPTTSYRSTTVLYTVFPLNYYIIYRGLCIVSINGSLSDERSIRVNFIKRNATASAVRNVSTRLLGHPSAYACAASFKATPPHDERETPPRQIHRDRVETKNNVNLPVTLYSIPYPFSPRAPPTLSASVGVSPSWTL